MGILATRPSSAPPFPDPPARPRPSGPTPRLPRKPFWLYSRTDRLRDLADRARGLETYLTREQCDARPADRPALDARLAIVARRVRQLCEAARDSARLDKHYDRLALEAAVMDALERGHLFPADHATA
jgi:hypothetical protein